MAGRTRARRVWVALLLPVLAGTLFLLGTRPSPERVYPGVSLLGEEMGGLDATTLSSRLQATAASLAAIPATLKLGDTARRFTYGELGLSLDEQATAQALLAAGRQGPFPRPWLDRWRARRYGLPVHPVLRVREPVLQAALEDMARGFERPARNAELVVDTADGVSIREAVTGRQLDRAAARRALEEMAATGQPFQLVLPWRAVEPLVSTADVRAMRVQGLLSAYSTPFNPGNEGRTANLRLAVRALNGALIPPGDTFSFNRTVGPRLAVMGYQEAKIIQADEFVDGVGGGVCQVSSTLYNAALLAGLPITERRRHSLPVDYVPPGRDATVVYGAVDLRFRNNTTGYLVVVAGVQSDRVVVKLFGDTAGRPVVELFSRVGRWREPGEKRVPDQTLAPGEQVVEREGRRGYHVQVVRRFRLPGGAVREEVVSEDTYPPLDRLVRVPLVPAQ